MTGTAPREQQDKKSQNSNGYTGGSAVGADAGGSAGIGDTAMTLGDRTARPE
ncbi:hypothetical protein [Streptomyces sp. YGL11-2]|uniref:hypothetical protein n=1 Tax=Streptomyces sp. YGL11-2 TaxID=3414028 RepID=UPI003CF83568